MWKQIICSSILLPACLAATDLKPWFPRSLEFQPRFTYLHQQYTEVDTGRGVCCKRSKDDFYTASLELAYAEYCGEIETTFAGTGSHHLGPEDVSLTLRYQLFDDVIGDPVSLVAGVTLSQVFSLALKDISTFYHGTAQGEIHAAIGRECSTWTTWSSRWWVVGAFGAGDHGSPWIRGEAAWEKNILEMQQVRFFIHTLYGLGRNDLELNVPFEGYGPIRHQSVDVGLQYRYTFDCDSILSAGFIRRVYSRNCPKDVNIYFVRYLYPFGL